MNITNYDKCVCFALRMRGVAGDNFKETNLRVYERNMVNPIIMYTTLQKGGIIISVVSASLFGESHSGSTATVIVSNNQSTGMVELYDPFSNEVKQFHLEELFDAWEKAGGVCTTAFPPDDNTYHPKLIDLKHVNLPDGLEELREAIAENAHDTWAMERQSEGWTYGPKRDDSLLETPDMVPYAQLPDSEKQYDRIMADDTLKLLIALGYNIEKR